MTTAQALSTAPAERAHKAAKRYIYAWGEGTAEGHGTMTRPPRRQGRQSGRDDPPRTPRPSRLHGHHGRLPGLLRNRRATLKSLGRG